MNKSLCSMMFYSISCFGCTRSCDFANFQVFNVQPSSLRRAVGNKGIQHAVNEIDRLVISDSLGPGFSIDQRALYSVLCSDKMNVEVD